jgi:hypothetical protein
MDAAHHGRHEAGGRAGLDGARVFEGAVERPRVTG